MNKAEQDFHKANHKADAEHNATLGKCFKASSDAHAALSKSLSVTDPDASAAHEDLAKCHKDAAASCAKAGQQHLDASDKIAAMATNEGGANGSSELKTILDRLDKMSGMPAGVSAVPRFDSPRTLVPRAGQPRVEDHDTESAKAAVDPALKDVIFDPRQARG